MVFSRGQISERLEQAPIEMIVPNYTTPVSYTHLRAHETVLELVCRLLLEKKKYLFFNSLSYRTSYPTQKHDYPHNSFARVYCEFQQHPY